MVRVLYEGSAKKEKTKKKENGFKFAINCLRKIVAFDFSVSCKFYIESTHLNSAFQNLVITRFSTIIGIIFIL